MSNIEKELQNDGIFVTEKIDTNLVLKITKNISKKICNTFPNFGLDEEKIFSKLFSLNMYKAKIPEGTLEASYCYKNCSIYFNDSISNEDLEEFAIHECIHYLQEVKNSHNKILKMGLSIYLPFKTVGIGLNEAAVQYISARIIGIKPDFEKYYDLNIFTPSPSYYPIECALLNELIFFLGEDLIFKSTFFSTNDFRRELIKRTSKSTFNKIIKAFDDILKYEEQIIKLKNTKSKQEIEFIRNSIKTSFIETQNLIIEDFFDNDFSKIKNLEELENFRRNLSKVKKYLLQLPIIHFLMITIWK